MSLWHIANKFFDHLTVPYGIPTNTLPDNGLQFLRNFLATMCVRLSVENLMTTAYHSQSSFQAETFSKRKVSCLRRYVTKHQKDWDLFVQPSTCASNKPVPKLHRHHVVQPCYDWPSARTDKTLYYKRHFHWHIRENTSTVAMKQTQSMDTRSKSQGRQSNSQEIKAIKLG